MTQQEFVQLISSAIAREVEWTAEMARQIGFSFPREYDLGISASLPSSTRAVVRVRIEDCYWREHVRLPQSSGDDQIGAFTADLHRAGSSAVQNYLHNHREIFPRDIEGALRALDSLGEGPATEAASAAARLARYTVKR